jgi:hypothetical protein
MHSMEILANVGHVESHFVCLETVLVMVQDRCMDCVKCTIGSLWGYRPVYPHGYTLMTTHGPCQMRWPNSPERATRIFELLGGPCGASRDYLMIKETKLVRIDIISSADTAVVISWD